MTQFFRYRHADGRFYRAKALGDTLFASAVLFIVCAIVFGGSGLTIYKIHMPGWEFLTRPINTSIAMVVVFAPFVAPPLYLFMKRGWERTLRFAAATSFCGWWLLMLQPCY